MIFWSFNLQRFIRSFFKSRDIKLVLPNSCGVEVSSRDNIRSGFSLPLTCPLTNLPAHYKELLPDLNVVELQMNVVATAD